MSRKELKMKKNLFNYIKKYSNFIDKEICLSTVAQLNLLNKLNWLEHTWYDPVKKKSVTGHGSKELSITHTNEITTKNEIMKKLWNGVHKYVKDLNFKWFDSWQGYSEIRFNKYSKGKEMSEHCDHIHSLFDGKIKGIPVLSVLGVLNEDYTGGEFIILEDKKINFKTGDLLIFPSVFLYPHKVNSVKSGNRYSFISWVW